MRMAGMGIRMHHETSHWAVDDSLPCPDGSRQYSRERATKSCRGWSLGSDLS